MFADEARFGRMNRPRPCWAPAGVRPEVASQLVREYIYLYGAVSLKDGICVYLIMPTSNRACFQTFLTVLSRGFGARRPQAEQLEAPSAAAWTGAAGPTYIERNPETVKSITSFPYIVRSL
jgi:hypothetical protein